VRRVRAGLGALRRWLGLVTLVYKTLLAPLQNACAFSHLYRSPLPVAVDFVSDTSLRSCLRAGLPGFYTFLYMASLEDQPSRQ
jgi:hypothetical protein